MSITAVSPQHEHLSLHLIWLPHPPLQPFQSLPSPLFQFCTSTDSPIYSALYAAPPPPVSLSLSPFLSSSWALALSCSVEVGHWVNSAEHDVISKVTEWVRSRKVKETWETGRRGEEMGWKWGKNGWSNPHLRANIVLRSRRNGVKMNSVFVALYIWVAFFFIESVCIGTENMSHAVINITVSLLWSDELAGDFSLTHFWLFWVS